MLNRDRTIWFDAIREVGSWNAAKNMASKDKSDRGDNAEFNFRRGTASS